MAESISQSLRSHSAIELSQSKQRQSLQPSSSAQRPLNSSQKTLSENKESAIESDYSEDFERVSMSGSMAQRSIRSSKNKLTGKMQDIEESAAYSETFEEESL